MTIDLRSPEWYGDLAELCDATGQPDFADRLVHTLSRTLNFNSSMVLVYRRDDTPFIVHDHLEHDQQDRFTSAYLSGIYLVSPFYREALVCRTPSVRSLKALAPDGFRQSDYYRAYYSKIGFSDLIGIFVPLDDGDCAMISLGRDSALPAFRTRDMNVLSAVLPLIASLVRRHWGDDGADIRRAVDSTKPTHAHVLDVFQSFARGELTAREAEIVKLVLLGHSSKSIARLVSISSETVRVHRRNIYAKMGLTSQGDLFSAFLTALGINGKDGPSGPLA